LKTQIRIESSRWLGAIFALALPGIAYAQEIHPIFAVLAVSPLMVILLAVALGVVSRSWRIGAAHAGLIVVWVLLFAIASYWIENDYIIWTPLVLFGVHAVTLLILVVKAAARRR